MCKFSWDIFIMTGNIDAYLLYKQASQQEQQEKTAVKPIPALEQSAIHNKIMPYYMGG